MPQPVSVIVPLFNKRSYVRETLESVLNQTVPVHQIIVVDDGSSDGGAEVVESFREPHIRLLRQPNAGVAAARNKGIELATGDLISFLDADDRYRPGYIENLLQMAERFPQAGLLPWRPPIRRFP